LQERFRSFSNPKFAAKVIAISISHQHQPSASAIAASNQTQRKAFFISLPAVKTNPNLTELIITVNYLVSSLQII
jgi:hypothetical protein